MLTRDAIASAFEAHHAYILRYCRFHVGSEAAEDLAALTWLHAIERAHQYEDRGVGVLPWLRSIARFRCWDYRRRAALIRMLPLLDRHAAPAPDRDAWIDALALVHGAGLTAAQKRVVALRAQGYKLREIAEATGTNTNPVKAREARGLARLARAREAVQ